MKPEGEMKRSKVCGEDWVERRSVVKLRRTRREGIRQEGDKMGKRKEEQNCRGSEGKA